MALLLWLCAKKTSTSALARNELEVIIWSPAVLSQFYSAINASAQELVVNDGF